MKQETDLPPLHVTPILLLNPSSILVTLFCVDHEKMAKGTWQIMEFDSGKPLGTL